MTHRPILVYTDSPIAALGDEDGKKAPIRRVEFLGYDGDKYCTVTTLSGFSIPVRIKWVDLFLEANPWYDTEDDRRLNEPLTYREALLLNAISGWKAD